MKAIRHIPITESFSFGWKKTWEQLGFIISFMLVGLAAQVVMGLLQAFGSGAVGQTQNGAGLAMLVFSILRMLVNVVFALAGLNAVLQINAGKKPTLSSAFKGMTEGGLLINYIIMNLVVGIIVMLGFIFFIIPGIYLSLKYFFTGYALVDKGGKMGDAMNKSSDITGGVKWELIAFGIVSALVNLVGFMALGFGLLITIPMTEIARGYVYRHLMKTA